jgi:two-component system, chemotaxis family, chemotaxis protein CheY
MKVLIIDDSVVMRMIVERMLCHAGLNVDEVMQAANGVEALAVLEKAVASEAPPDLILSDMNMPEMGGLDFLLERQRRNLAPGVPVLMITADGSNPQTIEAIAAGARGFISKPFSLQQMQTSIASLLLAAA